MIYNTNHIGLLPSIELVNEVGGLVEGTDHIGSIDSLGDVAQQGGATVGLKPLDFSRRVHVKTNKLVISEAAEECNYEVDRRSNTDDHD